MAGVLDCLLYKASVAGGKLISNASVKEATNLINSLKLSGDASGDLAQAIKVKNMLESGLATRQRNIGLSLGKQAEVPVLVEARLQDPPKTSWLNGMTDSDHAIAAARAFTFTDASADLQGKSKGVPWQKIYEGNHLLYGSMAAKALKPITPDYLGIRTFDALSDKITKDMWAATRGGPRDPDPIVKGASDGLIGLTKRGGEDFKNLGGSGEAKTDNPFGLFSQAEKLRGIDKDYGVAKQTWLDDIKAYGLDYDHLNKELPGNNFTKDNIDPFLSKAYDSEISGGRIKLDEYSAGLGLSTNSKAAHRLLQLDNYDGWKAYQTKYGQGSIFNWAMQYVDSIARENSLLQAYGPSPEAYKSTILRSILEQPGVDVSRAAKISRELDRNFRYSANDYGAGVFKNFNSIASGMRNLTVAGGLGHTAIMMQLMDRLGIVPFARSLYGLPKFTGYINNLGNFLQQGDRRQTAAEMGWLLDKYMIARHGDVRHMSDLGSGAWTKTTGKLANGVLTATGLHRSAFSNRLSNLDELSLELGRIADSGTLEGVNPRMKGWMESYGITDKDLANIKEGGMNTENYYGYDMRSVNPNQMFESGNADYAATAQKLSGLGASLTRTVSPMLNIRADKFFKEIAASNAGGAFIAPMFRCFTGFYTSLYSNIVRPMYNMNKFGTLAAFATHMTILGTVYATILDVLDGKDPRPLTVDQILRGFAVGGVSGPVGDFISSAGQYGGADLGRLAAPMGLVTNALKTGGALMNAAKGKNPDIAHQVLSEAKSLVPGQNASWAGLEFKRMLFEPLLRELDANAPQIFNKQTRDAQTNKGEKFWWAPGHTAPDRLPDFSQVLTPYSPPSNH